jgi:hypothetical protein
VEVRLYRALAAIAGADFFFINFGARLFLFKKQSKSRQPLPAAALGAPTST